MSDAPLYRSGPRLELRQEGEDGGPTTMIVNFARFNEWTHIHSFWEGEYMERFAPGAFAKTIRERGPQIRSIFQHGFDPVAGDKPLGAIRDMREEDDGAYGEVELLDADYVRQVEPGIRAGLYGASFAFEPVRTDEVDQPDPSEHNPRGIPEKTRSEVRLYEFGPVTFPAYAGTSTGIRSLTDDFVLARLRREQPDRLRDFLAARELGAERAPGDDTTRDPGRAPGTPTPAMTVARLRHDLLGRRWPPTGRRA